MVIQYKNWVGIVFFFSLFFFTAWCRPAGAMFSPKDIEINSESYYLYNLDTNTPLAAKNEHTQRQPASTVKIMTCILALENTEDLDEVFVYPQYVFDDLIGKNAAQADVRPGEEMTMRKALYCLMLQSDCVSALGIADRVGGGDVAKFVDMMNAKAQELGAVNTHFTNPHGLYEPGKDDDMHTTPYDLFLIARYAMGLEGFMEICSTSTMDLTQMEPASNVPAHQPGSQNWTLVTTIYPMLRRRPEFYEPIRGIKTGSLPEFGFNYVSTAELNGYQYLLVTMGAPYLDEEGAAITPRPAFEDAKNLYTWAFSKFEVRTLYEKGKRAGGVKVNLSTETDYVDLLAADDVSALVPVEAQLIEPSSSSSSSEEAGAIPPITTIVNLEDSYDAPVKKSQKMGTLDVIYNGDIIASVDLLAAKAVKRSEMLYILSMVEGVFSKLWVKFAVIFIILLVVFYVVLMILRNRYRSRYRRARGRRK